MPSLNLRGMSHERTLSIIVHEESMGNFKLSDIETANGYLKPSGVRLMFDLNSRNPSTNFPLDGVRTFQTIATPQNREAQIELVDESPAASHRMAT